MTQKIKGRTDLYPDAWERFERAIEVVAKSPPQHWSKKASPKKKKSPAKQRPRK